MYDQGLPIGAPDRSRGKAPSFEIESWLHVK